jgi:hypothetical protein
MFMEPQAFDYLKSWDELSNEEQWNFADNLISDRQKKGLNPDCGAFLEPKDVWYCKHMDAKMRADIEAHMTPQQRELQAIRAEKKRLQAEMRKAKRQLAKL